MKEHFYFPYHFSSFKLHLKLAAEKYEGWIWFWMCLVRESNQVCIVGMNGRRWNLSVIDFRTCEEEAYAEFNI